MIPRWRLRAEADRWLRRQAVAVAAAIGGIIAALTAAATDQHVGAVAALGVLGVGAYGWAVACAKHARWADQDLYTRRARAPAGRATNPPMEAPGGEAKHGGRR